MTPQLCKYYTDNDRSSDNGELVAENLWPGSNLTVIPAFAPDELRYYRQQSWIQKQIDNVICISIFNFWIEMITAGLKMKNTGRHFYIATRFAQPFCFISYNM